MGFYRGPNIIKDGLVFGYDADDRSSRFYKGEPTTNLLTYSQDFNMWAKRGVTVTNDNTIAPDGTPTASLWYCSDSSNHQLYKSYNSNGEYRTLSIYVKKTSYRGCYLGAYNNNYYAFFDIDTCKVSSIVGSGTSASIEFVGNGWYRISTYVPSITTEIQFGFLDSVYTGSATSPWSVQTITGTTGYIWGAQIEYKTHKTPYVKTNNVSNSRLSTNSLIDLTKSTIINLSNTKFDSSAIPYFNGIDSNMSINNYSGLNMKEELSIELIAKINSYPSSEANFVEKRSYNGYRIGLAPGKYIHTTVGVLNSTGGTSFIDDYGSTRYYAETGSTNHYLYSYSSLDGSTKLYVNGVLFNSKTNIELGMLLTDYTDNLYIGGFSGNSYIDGYIYLVRIYNKALSPNEILQNYNALKSRFNV